MTTKAKPTDLKVMERDNTITPRQLRSAGFVPATVYGSESEPASIQVKHREFAPLFLKGSRVFELTGITGPSLVRAKNLQVDPVSQKILSIEFLTMTQKEAKDFVKDLNEAEKQAEVEKAEFEEKMKDQPSLAEALENEPESDGATVAPEPAVEEAKA